MCLFGALTSRLLSLEHANQKYLLRCEHALLLIICAAGRGCCRSHRLQRGSCTFGNHSPWGCLCYPLYKQLVSACSQCIQFERACHLEQPSPGGISAHWIWTLSFQYVYHTSKEAYSNYSLFKATQAFFLPVFQSKTLSLTWGYCYSKVTELGRIYNDWKPCWEVLERKTRKHLYKTLPFNRDSARLHLDWLPLECHKQLFALQDLAAE